ncbi:MAG: hypothetical protein IRY85_14630 [Micromonosporaceae bacterium]|nr:hypothetical protein [Micromonosporaceae bacterium]
MDTSPWFSRSTSDTPVGAGPGSAPDDASSTAASGAAARVGPLIEGPGPDAGGQAAGPAVGPLVAFAVGRLAQGRRPEQAFCDLVELGTERRLAAIAVCVANGTPWDVAEERMVSFDDIWTNLGNGSAETAGGLLELYGYFDREVELTPDEAAIAFALRAAMGAVEYLPSGFANQMYRLLRTGKLREALFCLEEVGAQRWPDRESFWVNLTEAAVRLDSVTILDTEVAALRRRCESRLRP